MKKTSKPRVKKSNVNSTGSEVTHYSSIEETPWFKEKMRIGEEIFAKSGLPKELRKQ